MDAEQSTQQEQRVFNPTIPYSEKKNPREQERHEENGDPEPYHPYLQPALRYAMARYSESKQQAKRGRPRDCRSE
jgi:hypothetical protein